MLGNVRIINTRGISNVFTFFSVGSYFLALKLNIKQMQTFQLMISAAGPTVDERFQVIIKTVL